MTKKNTRPSKSKPASAFAASAPPPPPSPDPFSLNAADNTFLYALGESESGNNYKSINAEGCAGRWQFCPKSVGGPGWGKYDGDVQGWINDPAYQNQQMEAYTRNHWAQIVQAGLTKFLGQTISSPNGPIKVTPAALLGGAHLGGIGRLSNFLENGVNQADAGGTTISNYMAKFQNTIVPADWVKIPGAPFASFKAPRPPSA